MLRTDSITLLSCVVFFFFFFFFFFLVSTKNNVEVVKLSSSKYI
jgi:hypothetical protein